MTGTLDVMRAVLAYRHASAEEYAVVFTPNATGACRLVGEAYPFQPGSQLLLTADNHNSVNGLREFARVRQAHITPIPVRAPDLRIDETALLDAIRAGRSRHPRLLAYSAQSNFSGVQHPLNWLDMAHEYGYDVVLGRVDRDGDDPAPGPAADRGPARSAGPDAAHQLQSRGRRGRL